MLENSEKFKPNTLDDGVEGIARIMKQRSTTLPAVNWTKCAAVKTILHRTVLK